MKISAPFRLALFAATIVTVLACNARSTPAGSRAVAAAAIVNRHDADSTACFWLRRDSSVAICEYFRAGTSVRKDTSGLYE